GIARNRAGQCESLRCPRDAEDAKLPTRHSELQELLPKATMPRFSCGELYRRYTCGAIMSSEPIRRLFTVEECLRMVDAGILRSDERVELIRGEIIKMSPIGPRHGA